MITVENFEPGDYANWQEINLARIIERLRPLYKKPEGIIHRESSPFNDIVVQKFGTRVNLIFATDNMDRISTESRIDINRPLDLQATYSQIMMLSLIWVPDPRDIYIIGLGGGRLPMVLHHYCPQAVIECTEIDPVLPGIAEKYFGLAFDQRFKVIIQDGRQYLEAQPPDRKYDIMIMDAYLEALHSPYQFATFNFFELCKQHLTSTGLILVNLIASDPIFLAKIDTIQASFDQVYLCSYTNGDTVVVGTNAAPLGNREIVARARELMAKCHFSFPYVKLAQRMQILSSSNVKSPAGDAQLDVLQDDTAPEDLFKGLTRNHTLFRNLSGNDPCPCLSGRKFKHCHMPRLPK